MPETIVREYADPDDDDGDGVSGRVADTPTGIGRFGWKGKFARLEDAVSAALINELGLTTTRYPKESPDDPRGIDDVEVDEDTFNALTAFVRALPPLPPKAIDDAVAARGATLFATVGCAACHRPALPLERAASAGNGARVIHAYTDLLLHDMGPALADGLVEGAASGQEFRTPPLRGVDRTGPPYLHDGRAKTLHDAIVAHGGEAESAAVRYKRLSDSERMDLLAFVSSR